MCWENVPGPPITILLSLNLLQALCTFFISFSASHIRDILRKSYGDELASNVGAEAVLNVPEGEVRFRRLVPVALNV